MSHFNNLQTAFYQFIINSYFEYLDKKQKNELKTVNSSFASYLLYNLYMICGVQRKVLQGTPSEPKLVQLFYNRELQTYDPENPVTQFCKSVILDTVNMRIASLGFPMSLSHTKFMELTNNTIYTYTDKVDGTMIIWNNGLISDYNIDSAIQKDQDNDIDIKRIMDGIQSSDTTTSKNSAQKPLTVSPDIELGEDTDMIETGLKNFALSTRKVLGAGTQFEPSALTYDQIFASVCKQREIDLQKLPEKYKASCAFVFQLTTNSTVAIGPVPEECNDIMLVAAYAFKSKTACEQSWANVVSSETPEKILEAFTAHFTDAVMEVDLNVVYRDMIDNGVCSMLTLPTFYQPEPNNNTTLTSLEQSLKDMVSANGYKHSGYIVYGQHGERTTVKNENYESLRQLKGNRPLSLIPENSCNLFQTFWRLRQKKQLQAFIDAFDPTGSVGFITLFKWFESKVGMLIKSIYTNYHSAYVTHSIEKTNIPYYIKPLCAELHRYYVAKRYSGYKTTPETVAAYINLLPYNKIMWRINDEKIQEYSMAKISESNLESN